MKNLFYCFILFVSCFSFGQESLLSFKISDDLISFRTSQGIYSLKYFDASIIETSFVKDEKETIQNSHAIKANPEKINVQLKRSINQITFEPINFSDQVISIQVDSFPFKIGFYYTDTLLFEHQGILTSDNGYTTSLNIDNEEILYGGGVRALGMNRRGNKLRLYNRAHYGYETEAPLMNFCMPLFFSSKLYGVHFDNPGTGRLDLDSEGNNTVEFETIGKRKVYQLFAAQNWRDLVSKWTYISGRNPKPPIWSLGNFASRFGYHSQKEVEQTIKRYIKDDIPLDVVILDLYWFGKTIKGTMGNLSFDRDSFPDPDKMISKLNKDDIKTVLITEPFILTTSKRWDEAVENDVLTVDSTGKPLTYDFYFGNTGLIDIFSPHARNWFWERYEELIDMGVSGFWGDLGEPEVHPDIAIHENGTANEVHNIYGHAWAKMIYENYQKYHPNLKPFILMRAGYSGSQRYGMISWSGDVNRTWGGLRSQPEIALQMGLQGIPYMHSDLGGFAGPNDDPELYCRWLQYGVFQPVFRPHGQEEVASEPVFKEESIKELAKEAIELRYELLPYNYSLTCEAEKSGIPLMRPVFFYDNRPEMKFVDSLYFWGDHFLIAPVFFPQQKTKEIILPNNANWIDFYTGERYQQSDTLVYELDISSIPTFVKAESFIPMVNGLQNTSDYDSEQVNFHYFPDPTSKGAKSNYTISTQYQGTENEIECTS